jgi:hypothetical protein
MGCGKQTPLTAKAQLRFHRQDAKKTKNANGFQGGQPSFSLLGLLLFFRFSCRPWRTRRAGIKKNLGGKKFLVLKK